MDMEVVKFGFQVLQFIATAGVGFYVYMSNKDKVTNDRIDTMQKGIGEKFVKLEDDLDDKLEKQGERIAGLEAKTGGAPTHTDLSRIHEKINEVSNGMSALKGEFTATNRTLQLIHETLMERK